MLNWLRRLLSPGGEDSPPYLVRVEVTLHVPTLYVVTSESEKSKSNVGSVSGPVSQSEQERSIEGDSTAFLESDRLDTLSAKLNKGLDVTEVQFGEEDKAKKE